MGEGRKYIGKGCSPPTAIFLRSGIICVGVDLPGLIEEFRGKNIRLLSPVGKPRI